MLKILTIELLRVVYLLFSFNRKFLKTLRKSLWYNLLSLNHDSRNCLIFRFSQNYESVDCGIVRYGSRPLDNNACLLLHRVRLLHRSNSLVKWRYIAAIRQAFEFICPVEAVIRLDDTLRSLSPSDYFTDNNNNRVYV